MPKKIRSQGKGSSRRAPAATPASVVQNSWSPITNGLTDAILGYNPGIGTPGYSEQISQVNTIFINLRWYLISNMRQPLNQAYVELGLVKNVVDVPVNDAFKGGIDVKSKELDPEELSQLQTVMDEEKDIPVMAQSLKWDRLFGGAGVLVLTGDDWSTPLNIDTFGQGDPLGFRAVDMWELFWDEQNTQGDGTPVQNEDFEFYRYYGKNVHKSRVFITKGVEAPSFIRPRLRGWGTSIIETMIRSINQYLKATDLTFEVLDEFKIDVYKIKNLANTLLSATGTETIRKRVQLANMQKNYQNAITMDSEDDYIQKELSFAGIAETMAGIRMQVAADMNMPMSKIFGIASTGFSSGEDDIENYHGMVESTIRTPSKFHIVKMVKLRCMQLFGYIPKDLSVGFEPLRELSSEQQENVKTQQFNRLLAARSSNLVTDAEFREACNKDELLPLPLDTTTDSLNSDELTEEVDENNKDLAESNPTTPPSPKGAASKTKPKEAKT